MSQNGGKKENKLDLLKKWHKIVEVYQMISEGVSANQIAKFINDNGFKISTPMVYQFVKDYKSNIIANVHAEQFNEVDKKIESKGLKSYKKSVRKENAQERTHAPKEEKEIERKTVQHVKSDLEVIDSLIELGYGTLQQMEVVSPDVLLRAIKLKQDITGGETITAYGLEEVRIREQARETALLQIIQEYINPVLWDEVLDRMEEVTQAFYDSIGMGEAYRQAKEREG